MDSYYDAAQICLNGHAVNSRYHESPTRNQDFCDKCGQLTIYKCENCNTEIRGKYNVPGVCVVDIYTPPPNFCHKCGEPYPWTAKKMEAFKEMADELDELTPQEKEKLKTSLDDIVAETPKTELAGLKFKKILGKLGKDSYGGVKNILVDIASETVKKSLFGE